VNNSFFNKNVNFTIKRGNFPKINLNDDLFLIATGTGIAPLRSLLWERYYETLNNPNKSRSILFYGCRNKDKDYLYSQDYEIFKNNKNMNFSIFTAFSRDQPDKIYVQHLIKDNPKLIGELLFESKCKIFLVGNSKVLPKSIEKSFVKVILEYKNCSEEDSVKYFNYIKKIGRYIVETW
jgi:sulfite reductase alpha subunit-like flavoprotein